MCMACPWGRENIMLYILLAPPQCVGALFQTYGVLLPMIRWIKAAWVALLGCHKFACTCNKLYILDLQSITPALCVLPLTQVPKFCMPRVGNHPWTCSMKLLKMCSLPPRLALEGVYSCCQIHCLWGYIKLYLLAYSFPCQVAERF